MKYLLAVISGVGTAHEVQVRPAIQVWVLSTNEAISSVASPTLALVHGVTEVADVDAFGILVTVVGLVLARILWLTHLQKQQGRIVTNLIQTGLKHRKDVALCPSH